MSVQQSDLYADEPRAWTDDEIDLRQYVVVVVAWWREIILITGGLTLLAAALLWGWQSIQPSRYAASSDVVIARLTSRIVLDERITTSEESQQGGAAAWRASLLQLAQSPAIAQAVIVDLQGQIDPDWTPRSLLDNVTVANPPGSDGRTLSDLIRITVTTVDPKQSALIANTWATHYVDHINQVYGQVPGDTLAGLQDELEGAFSIYLDAQTAYESYIAESRVDRLQRQITEKITLRSNVQLGRDALLAATPLGANQVISSSVQAELDHLTQLYSRRSMAQVQLSQARNLTTQLEQADPASSASNLLALQLLKAQVFAQPAVASGQPLAVDLSLDLPALNADAAALATDARTLVTTLEAYLAWLDEQIAVASNTLSNEPNFAHLEHIGGEAAAAETGPAAALDSLEQRLAQLDQEIQSLRSQLAAEQATERQLNRQRDLTWNAYDALSNKLAELNLARTSANSEVRIGAQAVAPAQPEPGQSLLLIVAAVAVAAFFFALVFVLVAHAVGRKPLLARA